MSHSNIDGIPILLTSSVVAHDMGVRLHDPKERARLAMESIQQWRLVAPSNPLVLCDGSDFDFRPMATTVAGSGALECLHFQNDIRLVKQHGRGYGEGEIVRHAIEHSSLIQSAGCFAKCTSKLWVENFNVCMQVWNGQLLLKGVFDNVFSPRHATALAYIDTRFYAMNVQIYKQHFLHAHESIRAQEGYGLEDSFKDIFLSSHLQGCLMSSPPVIYGVGGGTGTYYKNTAFRQLKDRLRYKVVKSNPLFQAWFA